MNLSSYIFELAGWLGVQVLVRLNTNEFWNPGTPSLLWDGRMKNEINV
jgi:hypothetical protein